MKNHNNSATIPNNTKEVPITAHIFEGHLYLKENDKWLWRLFRFDGSTLTCLSSKKNKLPPHTLLDQPSNNSDNNRPISFNSAATSSFTSLLLATPKNKSVRFTSDYPLASSKTFVSNKNNEQPAIASYYQLPKWSIDMINISCISILKPTTSSKSRTYSYPFTTNKHKSKTFSIRTYDGGVYIMKAHKQHDLERWIFVLAKMWKFSQAARQLYQPTVSPTPQQQSYIHHPYSQNQQQPYHDGTPIMMPGPTNSTNEDHLVYRYQQEVNSKIYQNSPPRLPPHGEPTNTLPPLKSPSLSNEKVLWIEEWIKSLAEVAACGNSTSDLDYISTYESIEEEDRVTASAISGHCATRSISSSQNHHDRPILLTSQNAAHNKKKDSSLPSMHYNNDSSPDDAKNFNLNMFQDVNTVCTDETLQKKYNYQSLKYHNSTRGQRVKMVRHNTTENVMTGYAMPHTPPIIYNSVNSTSGNCYASPLENLKTAINNCNTFNTQQQQQQQQQATTANDENVCLADVQKFLKNMEINSKQKERYSMQPQPNSTLISPSSKKKGWHRNSWAPDISTFT